MGAEKKKRLRIALCAAVGAVVLGVALVVLLVLLLSQESQDPSAGASTTEFTFYQPYSGDIRENELYLSLDRQLYWCDTLYNSKEALDEGQIAADPCLVLIQAYLNSLIDGEPEVCRSLFTEAALHEAPIAAFAQQMLYRIEIRQSSQETENGVTKVTYRLDYMIHRNNGTYRRDVGSDAVRPEYLMLIEVADGEYRIDGIRR